MRSARLAARRNTLEAYAHQHGDVCYTWAKPYTTAKKRQGFRADKKEGVRLTRTLEAVLPNRFKAHCTILPYDLSDDFEVLKALTGTCRAHSPTRSHQTASLLALCTASRDGCIKN